jgi:hypothetical protein
MRPILVGSSLALCVALLVSLAACGGANGHLTASADALDFGLVVHGQNVVRTVRVTNEGRKGVVLTAAIPSCKCLVVDPSFQKSLQPGESAEIRITLESGTVTPQKFQHKRLEVRSDDPGAPTLAVALHGEIAARVTVVPTMLRVGADDAAGRGEPRRIKIRTPKGMTAQLLPVVVSHPAWFTTTAEPTPDGVDLVLAVTPDAARRGPVDAVLKLQVRVTGGGLPPATMPFEVRIQGTW